ncbi:MAG: hypothetical protein OXG53_14220 [Chloroflexi bacterium]|nr:hypothetical protein [Chloroflexota bacterium]
MLDRYFYTYHNPAGNRFLRGAGSFPYVIALDAPLRGTPVWAVGYAMETAIWHVVLEGGHLQVVEVTLDGDARTLAFESGWFDGAQPPIVGVSMIEGTYVMRCDASVSPLSHPIPANDFEVLYINRAGDLVLGREDGVVASAPINAPLDARLVMNSRGQVALYANATDQRYRHSVIGGQLAASTLLVLEASEGQIRMLARIDLPGEDSYEGIAPFWADLDGDGVEDLVTTVSNGSLGARIRAYIWDGAGIRQEMDGPPIERGNRWRHQLTAGRFGPDGAVEIVAIRNPHQEPEMEFFRLGDGALELAASFPGVTTHALGSRNLDQTAAGDFNGDGRPEVLAMDLERRAIAAVQRNEAGANEVWRLKAGGEIVSNFAPVELLDGNLALAVGTDDNRLRVWLPTP